MNFQYLKKCAGLALLLGALTACEAPVETKKPGVAIPPQRTAESFYQQVELRLRKAGLMRTETNPPDARFDYDDLVQDFRDIALYDEYEIDAGVFVARRTPAYLRKWQRPVNVGMIFGPGVTAEQRARDRETVAQYTRRLAKLTGLEMSMTDASRANMLLLVVAEEETGSVVDNLPTRFRFPGSAVNDALRNSPRDVFCAAFAFSDDLKRGEYEGALILVKAEHGALMRQSCVHEEMAQAMGLPNDSKNARPSIFNDDEEFALLTVHDEILLQMLYDPRLRPGMTEAQVLPLLPQIARDAAGFGS
ncbi:MAG TPA: DUF2927 domain-containing protein [Paracoccaceae bacterium]|nr:DUF2927 domain-containing protein [Paracoccaceae bacterium]